MNVEYLDYTNGVGEKKKLPIRVSYYALKKVKEDTNKSLSDVKDDDFDVYESLLYHSLSKGHQVEGMSFNLKKADMEDVMDQVYFQFMKVVPKFFEQAQTPATIARDGQSKNAKKPTNK